MNNPDKGSASFGSIAGRALLWCFFLYVYIQIVSFNQSNIVNPILAGMYLILFGVHEVSHMLFSFLPDIFTAAAGSFSEIVFTSLVIFVAARAKSYWAMIFGLLWLMMALISTGNYMADASAQLMPLAGPGTDLQHDWHFVFGELGWLEHDTAIGNVFRFIGWMIGAGALLFGLFRIPKP